MTSFGANQRKTVPEQFAFRFRRCQPRKFRHTRPPAKWTKWSCWLRSRFPHGKESPGKAPWLLSDWPGPPRPSCLACGPLEFRAVCEESMLVLLNDGAEFESHGRNIPLRLQLVTFSKRVPSPLKLRVATARMRRMDPANECGCACNPAWSFRANFFVPLWTPRFPDNGRGPLTKTVAHPHPS